MQDLVTGGKMSRLGKLPISKPQEVTVEVKDNVIIVKGKLGTLKKDILPGLKVKVENDNIIVEDVEKSKISNMNQGTMRSLINNMVLGVTNGFSKELILEAREYKAQLEGKNLKLSLGFSHPITIQAVEGIKFEVPEEKRVIVSGIDKQVVGLISDKIKKLRKWEPYISKGIKYKGEKVRKKERKTGV